MRIMIVSRALLAFAAVSVLPGIARAHAILIDSQPAPHATVPPGPASIMLHFNSRIDRGRSVVTLVTPGSAPQRLDVGGDGPADVMTAQTIVQPGEHTLRWQVLAVDGHITRGDVPFTASSPALPRVSASK
jgi:methionine-rich copper-binding protein CopC